MTQPAISPKHNIKLSSEACKNGFASEYRKKRNGLEQQK